MDFTEQQIIAWVSGFFLPLCRVSAMVMTMPVIGTKMVPARIKIIVSAVITLLIYPLLTVSPQVNLPQVNLLDPHFILLVAQQLLVGIAIGFLFQLVFQAVIVSGEIISMQSGLSYATLVDPATSASIPVLSHFYITMVSLIFVSLNGHLLLIQLVIDSFSNFPISTTLLSQHGLITLIQTSAIVFLNALLISLPAIVALLLANISLAVMTRAAPQLNIFSIGFPITLMAGFFLLLFSLTEVSRQFYFLLEQAMSTVNQLLQ